MSEIVHKKPATPASQFDYKNLKQGEFWRHVPAYREIDEATFLDHLWQQKKSIKTPEELIETIRDLAPSAFVADIEAGFASAPMAVRVSPYALSLIDWKDPHNDPIRRQFIPMASSLLPDHPRLTLDSLHEQDDSPVPGLVHRYTDKALFLPLNVCPVYCRFCTRSYAIGPDTEEVDKVSLAKTPAQWQQAFQYISERPELEDIVISGGDTYQLPPKNIELIGNALLDIPHVRRMRFATKGPAIMPMKIITHTEWLDAIAAVVERGRKLGKDVVLHTHFNAPEEITWITQKAMAMLFERGIFTRNQSVLIRGVNDTPERMALLVKRLGHLNVHPYYVYMHDMVRGVEELRTTIQTAVDTEKFVRGSTAGFNTPTFVCDAPGGGGKRDVHS
ncbi:MAG TPA: KamA family radical SAM protein, partial [Candidatus Dormibacteraeota bacterium]|nr:KamA family radical SAM protein [Candidatus Dormibacteraeota bacterium]